MEAIGKWKPFDIGKWKLVVTPTAGFNIKLIAAHGFKLNVWDIYGHTGKTTDNQNGGKKTVSVLVIVLPC
uniref:Uncharacterized protein n=1 Tax=Glossina morsitans morsitans TaxID=37546 RepID=A0A1B0GE79_GLOMM